MKAWGSLCMLRCVEGSAPARDTTSDRTQTHKPHGPAIIATCAEMPPPPMCARRHQSGGTQRHLSLPGASHCTADSLDGPPLRWGHGERPGGGGRLRG